MSDKIVTHEHRQTLRDIQDEIHALGDEHPAHDLVRDLIAAAEADAPPLPEGWVLHRPTSFAASALWHKAGKLSSREGGEGGLVGSVGDAYFPRSSLTPLRPTITEADVEKAAVVLMDRIPAQTYRDVTCDMFRAAGVEVSKP